MRRDLHVKISPFPPIYRSETPNLIDTSLIMCSVKRSLQQANTIFFLRVTIPADPTRETKKTCITFIQCRPNVYDVGPTLYKCYTNVLCLLRRRSINVGLIIMYFIRIRNTETSTHTIHIYHGTQLSALSQHYLGRH